MHDDLHDELLHDIRISHFLGIFYYFLSIFYSLRDNSKISYLTLVISFFISSIFYYYSPPADFIIQHTFPSSPPHIPPPHIPPPNHSLTKSTQHKAITKTILSYSLSSKAKGESNRNTQHSQGDCRSFASTWS